MIRLLKVETKHDVVRVARAVKVDINEEFDYQLEFIQNKGSLNYQEGISVKTILRHQNNNSTLISYDFKLPRGLYDVYITRVDSINGTDIKLVEGTEQKYKTPIMVGGKYKVRVKTTPAMAYNNIPGLLVQIISDEVQLSHNMIYYHILKDKIKDIKYYIPFKDADRIQFFIENVNENEFSLEIGNPSFEIERVY